MKKAALLLCVLLLVGCGSNRRVTVMTYNIHHGAGTDGKLDLPRIARIITASKADLVALQELDLGTNRTNHIAQAEELGRLTKLHVSFGSAMNFDGGKYGDAVLSRYPIASSQIVALPWNDGNKREPRVAVIAHCTLPGERKLLFASTHLDHTGEPSDRYLQAKAINGVMQDMQTPAIVAGDFNCEVDSPPMQEILRHWKLISDADPTLTCPSDVPKEKIDHILLRPPERWRVIKVKVIDERVASDHRPVVAVLELN